MVHTWSIASHVAKRTSPERAAVSTRDSNASVIAGAADDDTPNRLDGRGHVRVGQRPPVLHDVVLRTEHRQDPVARIVVSQVHRQPPHNRKRSILR